MSIHQFPLAATQNVRRYIQKSLALPPAERGQRSTPEHPDFPEPTSIDALGDLFRLSSFVPSFTPPKPASSWSVSLVNPAVALRKLPGLQQKVGFRLVGFLNHTASGSTGIVWAVPEAVSTTAHLERALNERKPAEPPRPQGALSDVMEAIEGDRSPVSFLVASIFRRELQAFGGRHQGCGWNQHQLLDTVPTALRSQVETSLLRDLAPRVRLLPNQQAAVEFFTHLTTAPSTIFRHIDLYPDDSYAANSLDRVVTRFQTLPSPFEQDRVDSLS